MPSAAKRRKTKTTSESSTTLGAFDVIPPSKSLKSTTSNASSVHSNENKSMEAKMSTSAWKALDPPLSGWLLSAVGSMGFTKMTPVQASTIPLFMGNKDVVVEAVTGSGKTLAFLIPVVERILRRMLSEDRGKNQSRKIGIGAIIISPTRELASQIYSVLLSLLQFHGPSAIAIPSLSTHVELDHDDVQDQYAKKEEEDTPLAPALLPISSSAITPQLVVGGTNRTPSQDLRTFVAVSPSIIIGTPGRLNELLSSPYVHCTSDTFEALVLDEADRLLDLGFEDILQRIIARLPKQRRTGLFSASISDAVIGSLVKTGLRNPVKVSVKVQGKTAGEEKRTPASLDNRYIICSPSHRLHYVQRLLAPSSPHFILDKNSPPRKSIIYLSNCSSVDYFSSLLLPLVLPKSISIIPLHGKQSSSARTRNFHKFSTITSPSVLVSTDLASRGLDIPSVDLVIQIDPPTDPKVFLHRCGRAGRAGRRGLAVLFLSFGREEEYIDFLAVRKTPVSRFPFPENIACQSVSEKEISEHTSRAREAIKKDRALYEKSMKSFVSHVRAYSKHQTSSIFRLNEINWFDLVTAYALIKVPKMPELKSVPASDLPTLPEIDVTLIPYKDPNQERKRLQELEKSRNLAVLTNLKEDKEARVAKMEKNSAWSVKKVKKEVKEERKEKKRKRKEVEKESRMTKEEREKEAIWKDLVEEVKRRKVEERNSNQKKKDVEMDVDLEAIEEEEFKGFG